MPERESIADAGSDYTLDVVCNQLKLKQESFNSIVDLGCGTGILCTVEYSNSKDYLGIDLTTTDTVEVAPMSGIRFIEQSLSDPIPREGLEGPTCYVASNTLCYLVELDADLSSVLASGESGDLFFVVEPQPSLFWEVEFQQTQVFLRTSQTLESIFKQSGWESLCGQNISLISIAAIPLFPIFYTKWFRKL